MWNASEKFIHQKLLLKDWNLNLIFSAEPSSLGCKIDYKKEESLNDEIFKESKIKKILWLFAETFPTISPFFHTLTGL